MHNINLCVDWPFLSQVFGSDTISFQSIPELVNRYLGAPDPVILHYAVNPAVLPAERPSAWDVEVKTEDVSMKSRMSVMISASKDSALALEKMDEEVNFFSSTTSVGRLITPEDLTPGPIFKQLPSKKNLPAIFCRWSSTFHTEVARVAVAWFGDNLGQWPKWRYDCETGRTQAQRILPVTLGRGGE